jgi:hypothetical protein
LATVVGINSVMAGIPPLRLTRTALAPHEIICLLSSDSVNTRCLMIKNKDSILDGDRKCIPFREMIDE